MALLYKILSGQHKTNAGFEFVLGPKAVESEWSAMLGSQLNISKFIAACLHGWHADEVLDSKTRNSKPRLVWFVKGLCIDVLSHAHHFIGTGKMKLGLRSC